MKGISKYGLAAVVVILVVLFGMFNPVFISVSNLINVIDQIAIIGIIALGMTIVIIIGGIDLSVGSIVAFAGIVLAKCLVAGLSLPLSIFLCLLTGIGLGFINGFFIAYGKVPAFIATLGLMSVARGSALYLTDGRSVSGIPEGLSSFVTNQILGFSAPTIIFTLLSIVFWLVLKYTYWGKYIYAIGGNEKAAWLSGIKVRKYKLLVYSLSGLASAIACIMLVGKLNSAQPQAGNMYELNAIAAVVIGGASLSGGKGEIWSTFLGVLILGILQNGFSILNIPSYYQLILVGLVIIFAVIIDSKSFKINNYEK